MNIIKQNVSLREKTSFHIGGPADFYAKAQTDREVLKVLIWANDNNLPVFILGKGSNILMSDSGWPGLILDISGLASVKWHDRAAVCQSGALLHTLVKESVDRGFSGMEELAGIPGSIGGALVMNAGAFKQTVSDCLDSVKGIDCSNHTEWNLKREEIDFGYRTSSLEQMNSFILSATFLFNHGDKNKLAIIYHEILQRRNKKQPLDMPNCGSVFKRPKANYAGALIEKCGLKGYCVGGAMVSPKHANFIVNTSDATAHDVRKLIVYIQKKVFEQEGILLEPEVIFVGKFDIRLFNP